MAAGGLEVEETTRLRDLRTSRLKYGVDSDLNLHRLRVIQPLFGGDTSNNSGSKRFTIPSVMRYRSEIQIITPKLRGDNSKGNIIGILDINNHHNIGNRGPLTSEMAAASRILHGASPTLVTDLERLTKILTAAGSSNTIET